MPTLAIVDDAKYISEFVKFTVERDIPELEVRIFGTGQAFLKALDSQVFDVVLMDGRLPDTSGIDLTMRLSAENPKTYVIGFSLNDLHNEFIAAGAKLFLGKTVSNRTLVKAIREAAKL